MKDLKKILMASIPVLVALLIWEVVGKKITSYIPGV